MLFNSYIFILCFLPVTVIGYFLINKVINKNNGEGKVTADLWWLFLASVAFYGYANLLCTILLLSSIAINYYVSIKINLCKEINKIKKTRLWLVGGISFNIILLGYFKYSDFFIVNLNQLFQREYTVKNLILPLGISFFTFKQIAYLADCYRKKVCYQWIEYAAYVMFFPQLISGPIGLHDELIPQLRDAAKKRINYENLSQGLYAIALGLGKKVLIADSLSKIVTVGYTNIEGLNGISAWMVMLSYTLQIYFDFSGYSDIALGIERLLNLEPVINFNSPYKAKSVGEFWERWHMSLTRFFTRYVYIPLGGSKKGKGKTYFNTILVFLLSGLWHGANWTFILWGGLHGLVMVLEKGIKDAYDVIFKYTGRKINVSFIGKILGTVYTFFFVNIAWILFRASSIQEARLFISRLFVKGREISPLILQRVNDLVEIRILSRLGLESRIDRYPYVTCFVLMGILLFGVYFLKNTQQKIYESKYGIWRSIITMFLIVWSVVSFSEVSEFLYFNF